ncbi:hypothetical protein Dimus_037514, partial [Dionaea muscipula]
MIMHSGLIDLRIRMYDRVESVHSRLKRWFTTVFGLPCAHKMCVLSQNRCPVDLDDVRMIWRTLTVGDEERVYGAHEDPERPDALWLINESLEIIKNANPDQQMFYARAVHSLIHPE